MGVPGLSGSPVDADPSTVRPNRLIAATGHILVTAGVVVLLFVGYQVWGTGLQEARAQEALAEEFDALLAETATDRAANAPAADPDAAADGSPTADSVPTNPPLSSFDRDTVVATLFPEPGAVTARIRMPAIDVDKLVVEGVAAADLRRGPGHYPATAQPGFEGNASIAGHRTTYGQPFRDVDRLVPGDRITVTTLVGTHVYEVMDPAEAFGDRLAEVDGVGAGHVIVPPRATWVLGSFGDDRLTLTACHPAYSARQRIVVAARLLRPGIETPPIAAAPDALAFSARPERSDAPTPGAVVAAPGLDGGDGGLFAAVLLGAVALALYVATLAAGRRWRRLPAYAIGAGPVAWALFGCFQQVDRILPAY
jgi:sortase A